MEKMDIISTRVPAYIIPHWIAYCNKRQLTQSDVIRRAIARYIENDDTATDGELVVAATIEDGCRSYSLRSGAEREQWSRRWRSLH